ncbi:MAG: hypothetical protein ACOCP1_00420 [Campylobacterales bacterium]
MQKADQKRYERRVLDLLYYDLLESAKIKPSSVSKNFDRVDFESSFSLHNIRKPYVKWAVVEGEEGVNYLVRGEAPKTFSLNNSTNYYLDVLGKNVDLFKITYAKEFVEIYLKFESQKPLHLKLYVGEKD